MGVRCQYEPKDTITLYTSYKKAKEKALDDIDNTTDEELAAWVKVIDLPISMIQKYDDYENYRTRFDTHQGVKGLEFDRVMVIIDDTETNGFLFSYDKLFGVKDLTDTDIKNISEGKDSSITRIQRLFYVICTRAKKSFVVVMYTSDPAKVKSEAIAKGWFRDEEIEVINRNLV